jgi:threonine dehydrogenase-like Zn-dependent dehydrogenase
MYQKRDYETAIDYVHQGKINLEPLITHRFAFREYQNAYQAIDASEGQYMKVMVDLGSL